MIKIVEKKGLPGYFELGDSISKVLVLVQKNSHIFGRIEIIASKQDLRHPLFLVLPDAGFKLRFEFQCQTLEMIEIYLQGEYQNKKLTLVLRDCFLNQPKMASASFNSVNTFMGPTFPGKIFNENVLLTYEGISFVFAYGEGTDPISGKKVQQELKPENIHLRENELAKVNIMRKDFVFKWDGRLDEDDSFTVHILLDLGIKLVKRNGEEVLVYFGD
mmetsp:Transcript_40299/g.38769  ORF Transcript_40299/g.38769 Transcript_40299/m.38769 type:complete len:217 (-) Transcript_40299:694-1344(-)